MLRTHRSTPLLLAAIVALGACATGPSAGVRALGDQPAFAQGSGHDGSEDSDPVILDLADDHAPFFNQSVSFWAKAGSNAEGAIYFQDDRGRQGNRYARLKLSGRSLLSYPDGRPFAKGDSILITMTVDPSNRMLFEMEPTGLRFSSDRMAELRIDYSEANPDYNHDGVVDAVDAGIKALLAIWVQEASEPFLKLGSVNFPEIDELVARINGFSRFAIAY